MRIVSDSVNIYFPGVNYRLLIASNNYPVFVEKQSKNSAPSTRENEMKMFLNK